MNEVFVKKFTAGAAINPRRLVKMGASDGLVIEAVDASAPIIGASADKTYATNDEVEVVIAGIAKVRTDGTPARGTLVTATVAGKAAAIGAGTANQYVAGIIQVTAADEDICDVLLTPGNSVNLGIT